MYVGMCTWEGQTSTSGVIPQVADGVSHQINQSVCLSVQQTPHALLVLSPGTGTAGVHHPPPPFYKWFRGLSSGPHASIV